MKHISKVIFILTLLWGFHIASHRPLWTDEIWTQINAVPKTSYIDMITAKMWGEGNKCPLFYLQQKLWEAIIQYKSLPDMWKGPQTWREKVLLRLPTLITMSFFIAYMFSFFRKRFNIWLGFLAVGLLWTTPVIVWHWTEARPYTLWVCLTGLEFILLIRILEARNPWIADKKLIELAIIHILLSLTCIISMFQIIAVSVVLFFFKPQWKWYIFGLAVPMALCYFYRQNGSVNDTIFLDTPNIVMMKASNDICVLILLSWFFFRQQVWFFTAIGLLWLFSASFLYYLYIHSHNIGAYIISRHVMDISIVEVIGAVYLIGITNWRKVWQSINIILKG